jgi:putative hemolysin
MRSLNRPDRVAPRRSRGVTKSSLLLGAVGLLLAGCGNNHKNQPTEMPNPASVFCEAQGGKLDLGAGICVLPDGTRVDEWEYYRTQTSGQTGLANPAAVFCEDQGGTVSGPEPMCRLPNGTEVDAWDYFRKNAPP